MNGRVAVEALHRSTRHGERPARPDRLLRFRPLDPGNRPAPFKTYAGVDTGAPSAPATSAPFSLPPNASRPFPAVWR